MSGSDNSRGVLDGAESIRLRIPGHPDGYPSFRRMGNRFAQYYGVEAMYKAVNETTLPPPSAQYRLQKGEERDRGR